MNRKLTLAVALFSAALVTQSYADIGVKFTDDFSDGISQRIWRQTQKAFVNGLTDISLDASSGVVIATSDKGENTPLWGGNSIVTTQSFDFGAGEALKTTVDRTHFKLVNGKAVRSGIFLRSAEDESNYFFFGEDTNQGWCWNANDPAKGVATSVAAFAKMRDGKSHTISLVYDGTVVDMYVDDVYGGYAPWSCAGEATLTLGYFARDNGDMIDAGFDNVKVEVVTAPVHDYLFIETFNTTELDQSKWLNSQKPIIPGGETDITITTGNGQMIGTGKATAGFGGGRSIKTVESFSVDRNGPLEFVVNRSYLKGEGAVSALILTDADRNEFCGLSQRYFDGTYAWVLDLSDGEPETISAFKDMNDGGDYDMKLVYDGRHVDMYLAPAGTDLWTFGGSRSWTCSEDVHVELGFFVGFAKNEANIDAAFGTFTVSKGTSSYFWDDFDFEDQSKWKNSQKPLVEGGATTVTFNYDGKLNASGEAIKPEWGGRSIVSVPSFNLSTGDAFQVIVGRTSFSGVAGAKNSIFLRDEERTTFFVLSDDSEQGWTYGVNDAVEGTVVEAFKGYSAQDIDVKLVFDGKYVEMFLGDKESDRWISAGNPAVWDYTGPVKVELGFYVKDAETPSSVTGSLDFVEASLIKSSRFWDDFDGTALDETKWRNSQKPYVDGETDLTLEVADSMAIISGTATKDTWGGRSIYTRQDFEATPANPLQFGVIRPELTRLSETGTVRAGVFLRTADRKEYIFFGEDIGGENPGWGWDARINADDTLSKGVKQPFITTTAVAAPAPVQQNGDGTRFTSGDEIATAPSFTVKYLPVQPYIVADETLGEDVMIPANTTAAALIPAIKRVDWMMPGSNDKNAKIKVIKVTGSEDEARTLLPNMITSWGALAKKELATGVYRIGSESDNHMIVWMENKVAAELEDLKFQIGTTGEDVVTVPLTKKLTSGCYVVCPKSKKICLKDSKFEDVICLELADLPELASGFYLTEDESDTLLFVDINSENVVCAQLTNNGESDMARYTFNVVDVLDHHRLYRLVSADELNQRIRITIAEGVVTDVVPSMLFAELDKWAAWDKTTYKSSSASPITGDLNIIDAFAPLNDGKEHLISMTYDGVYVNIYLDRIYATTIQWICDEPLFIELGVYVKEAGTSVKGSFGNIIAENYEPRVTITDLNVPQSANNNGTTTMSVEAVGVEPFTYQWYKDGAAIEGATDKTYTIDPVTMTSGGNYYVIVKNAYGEPAISATKVMFISSDPADVETLLDFPMNEGFCKGSWMNFTASAEDRRGFIHRALAKFSGRGNPVLGPAGELGVIPDDYAAYLDLDSLIGHQADLLNLTNAFTIEAWIKPTEITTEKQDIIRIGDSIRVGLSETGLLQATFLDIRDMNSDKTIEAGKWQHIACVWEPTVGVHFYLNGEDVFTRNFVGYPADYKNDNITVGSDGTTASKFVGLIDRLRVHSTMLYDVDLDSDPAAPQAPYAETVLSYSFNEGDVIFESDGTQNVPLNSLNNAPLLGRSPVWIEGPAFSMNAGLPDVDEKFLNVPVFAEDHPRRPRHVDNGLWGPSRSVTEEDYGKHKVNVTGTDNVDWMLPEEDYGMRPVLVINGATILWPPRHSANAIKDSKYDYALYFERPALAIFNTDTIDFGDTTDLSFTMEAWIKDVQPSAKPQVIFQTKGNTAGTCPSLVFAITENNTVAFTTTDIDNLDTGIKIPEDPFWHHISVAYNYPCSMVYVYIDGELRAVLPYDKGVNFNVTADDMQGCLGSEVGGSTAKTDTFGGCMDRVRLSKGAVPPSMLDYPPSTPVPPFYYYDDINPGEVQGDAMEDPQGTYILKGSGKALEEQGGEDSLFYVYNPIKAESFDFSVKVESLTAGLSGIMIREGDPTYHDQNSLARMFLVGTLHEEGAGYGIAWRDEYGKKCSYEDSVIRVDPGMLEYPHWERMIYDDGILYGFYSTDEGENKKWHLIGYQDVSKWIGGPLGSVYPLYAGMFVDARGAEDAVGVFSELKISQGAFLPLEVFEWPQSMDVIEGYRGSFDVLAIGTDVVYAWYRQNAAGEWILIPYEGGLPTDWGKHLYSQNFHDIDAGLYKVTATQYALNEEGEVVVVAFDESPAFALNVDTIWNTARAWYYIPGYNDINKLIEAYDSYVPPVSCIYVQSMLGVPDMMDGDYDQILYGWFHPETTADYTFFIASDGQSQLWLSKDKDPKNMGRTPAAEVRDGTLEPFAWNAEECRKSKTVTLEAGEYYYFELFYSNGGPVGRNLGVAWSTTGEIEDGADPIPAKKYDEIGQVVWRYIEACDTGIIPQGEAPVFVQDPVDVTTYQTIGKTVTFSVEVTGSEPIVITWMKDGVVVPSLYGRTIEIPCVAGANGEYVAVADSAWGSAESKPAQLRYVPFADAWQEYFLNNYPVEAFWTFEDNVADGIAHDYVGGYDGQYVNVETEDQIAGAIYESTGRAIHFNGTDSCVTTPLKLNPLVADGQFSVLGWLRRDSAYGPYTTRGGYFGQNDLLEFGDARNADQLEVWAPGTGAIKVNHNFVDKEWSLIVLTYNKDEVDSEVLYLNGQAVYALGGEIDAAAGADYNLNIAGGGIFGTTGDFFLGDIDEVAVLPYALTAQEVEYLYGVGVAGGKATPVITKQPVGNSWYAIPGETFTLTLNVVGTPEWTTEWFLNGEATGLTGKTIEVDCIPENAGTWTAKVTNALGSTVSEGAEEICIVPESLYARTVVSMNPIAYWRLGELTGTTAHDYAGGNDGTYTTAQTLGKAGAILGDADTAVGFNGAGYVNAPMNWTGENVTMIAWIKRNGNATDYTGIMFDRGSSAAGIDLVGNQVCYHWNDSRWDYRSGLVTEDGQWNMIALTVDPTGASFYLGDSKGNFTTSRDVTALRAARFTSQFTIGGDMNQASRRFNGDIDEAVIYDRVLSFEEIENLYNIGKYGPYPVVVEQPQSLEIYLNDSTFTLSVNVRGAAPLNVQWYHNGVPTEYTGSTLTLPRLEENGGMWQAFIGNDYGIAVTDLAVVSYVEVTSEYEKLVSDLNPWVYWRLNEAPGATLAADYANNISATYAESNTLGVPGAIVSEKTTAVSFEGPSAGLKNAMIVPNIKMGTTDAVTFLVWVKRDGNQADYSTLLFNRAGAGDTTGLHVLAENNTLGYHWNDQSFSWDYDSGLSLENGVWNLAAMVVTADKAVFYLGDSKGNLTSTENVTAHAPTTLTSDFSIGGDLVNSDRQFKGALDEPVVFNYALTEEQIRAIYDAGRFDPRPVLKVTPSPVTGTLVLSWPASAKAVLQVSTTASSEGMWVQAGDPTIVGDTCYFEITPSVSPTEYYRLIVP